MNWICIGVAAMAALCWYLASPHQRLWRPALRRGGLLRWLSAPLATGAVVAATQAYGAWCGVCIALSGSMTMLVALPYLDAWLDGLRARREGARHVG
jgi:hypothetical protein